VGPSVLFALVAVLWVMLAFFFWRYRIWIAFYIVASVGLTFLMILAGTRLFPLERWMEMSVAYSAHAASQVVGIPTRVFEAAPGNILVWVIVQDPGWTVVRVDLECSGLLEVSVLSGLLLFYPAWSVGRRAWLTLVGWLATFGANVVRVVVIILILHILGKRSIFVAHTVAGRLVFFGFVAGIYWVILTRGTVHVLTRRLQERMRA
jgi:exosortase family protein XrtG